MPAAAKGAAAAVAAAAAAAAAAQYDPARFERLRSSPGPAGPGTPIGTSLERLLRDYLLVMAAAKDSSRPNSAGHWAVVASACIDFCSTVKRTDLLFGPVYDAFVTAEETAVLLLALEPYIRAGKLDTLTPVVMKAFVEVHTAAGALGRVERSLLLLDLGLVIATDPAPANPPLSPAIFFADLLMSTKLCDCACDFACFPRSRTS